MIGLCLYTKYTYSKNTLYYFIGQYKNRPHSYLIIQNSGRDIYLNPNEYTRVL